MHQNTASGLQRNNPFQQGHITSRCSLITVLTFAATPSNLSRQNTSIDPICLNKDSNLPVNLVVGRKREPLRPLFFSRVSRFLYRKRYHSPSMNNLLQHWRYTRRTGEMFYVLTVLVTSACILLPAWTPEKQKVHFSSISDVDVVV